jgi:putative transposase
MSVRGIRGHLEELSGIHVSAGLISAVIGRGRGMAEPTAGCLLSAGVLRRDTGQKPRRRLCPYKAVYIALGIRPDGTKGILGIWIEQTESAKFWLRVMNGRTAALVTF